MPDIISYVITIMHMITSVWVLFLFSVCSWFSSAYLNFQNIVVKKLGPLHYQDDKKGELHIMPVLDKMTRDENIPKSITKDFKPGKLKAETLAHMLDGHKAVVFSSIGAGPCHLDEFAEFVDSFKLSRCLDPHGAATRKTAKNTYSGVPFIFTDNEAPADIIVPVDHEYSIQVEKGTKAKYVFLFCDQVPTTGGAEYFYFKYLFFAQSSFFPVLFCLHAGETCIVDSTKLYRYVSTKYPDFVAKLKKLGVRYTHTLTPYDGVFSCSHDGRGYFYFHLFFS